MQLTAQLSGGASAAELATKLVTLKHPEPKADVWVASVRGIDVRRRGLCDTYLRTLLIHGARAVLTHSKEPPVWVKNLLQRRPLNVAVVALANKMARTLWALLAHAREYQPRYVSQPA